MKGRGVYRMNWNGRSDLNGLKLTDDDPPDAQVIGPAQFQAFFDAMLRVPVPSKSA